MNPQDFTKAAGFEQIEAAVKTSQDTAIKVLKASKDTAQKFYQAQTDAVAQGYDKATAYTREQVEKAFPQAVVKFDEAAALTKENMTAAVTATTVANKGWEALAEEMTAFGKKAAETHFANWKALSGVKSFQEALELQTGFARAAFDNAMAGATKMAEIAVKTANEVAEPMQARVSKVVEKYGKPMAA